MHVYADILLSLGFIICLLIDPSGMDNPCRLIGNENVMAMQLKLIANIYVIFDCS